MTTLHLKLGVLVVGGSLAMTGAPALADVSFGLSARVGTSCSAKIAADAQVGEHREALIRATCNAERFALTPSREGIVFLAAGSNTAAASISNGGTVISVSQEAPGRREIRVRYASASDLSGISISAE